MKCEIREICGDWALDINNFNGGKITIYFNSRQNALNVKRILEVDNSIPNAATVCDMQEVVRCKDCKYFLDKQREDRQGICMCGKKRHIICRRLLPLCRRFLQLRRKER